MSKNTDRDEDKIIIEAISRSRNRALDRLEDYENRIAQLGVKISDLEDKVTDLSQV